MRQASWEELFKQGSGDEEAQPGFLNRLRGRISFVSWEELVTLVIVLIGFYSGNSRLDVVSGPKDNDNRVRAGTLQVR